MGYIQTMEYYSALKWSDLSSHEKTQKGSLNVYYQGKENNQDRLITYCMIPTTWHSEKAYGTVKYSAVASNWGKEVIENYFLMCIECLFYKMKRVTETYGIDDCTLLMHSMLLNFTFKNG